MAAMAVMAPGATGLIAGGRRWGQHPRRVIRSWRNPRDATPTPALNEGVRQWPAVPSRDDTGHGARTESAVRAAQRPVAVGTKPDVRGPWPRTAPARPTQDDSESSPLRSDQLEGSPRGTHRRRWRPAEVLVLRQEPEAGEEAH